MKRILIVAGMLFGGAMEVRAADAEKAAKTEEVAPAGEFAPAPVGTVGEVTGRVLLREEGRRGQTPAKPGAQLAAGAAVVTGRQARAELLVGDGRWRLGALAVWQAEAEGVRLLSGSALVLVPKGAAWRVRSLGGELRLGTGAWMLTAVRNEGLKIVCLEAAGELTAELAEDAGKGKTDTRRLRAGELVFLRPGGKGFGPVLTVFLEELLLTSRLVNGFAEPLPELARLRVVAAAQRERLGGVTNALVGGATDDRGFEVVVPKEEPAK